MPVIGEQAVPYALKALERADTERKEKVRLARMGELFTGATAAKSRQEIFDLMGAYPDLFDSAEDVSAYLKLADSRFPTNSTKPVKVTAQSADGTKQKVQYLFENQLPTLSDPEYVKEVFGPEYSIVFTDEDTAKPTRYYSVKPAESEFVAPESSLVGLFLPGQQPPGTVAEKDLEGIRQRADDKRALHLGESDLAVKNELATLRAQLLALSERRAMNAEENQKYDLGLREIDKFMELDKGFASLRTDRQEFRTRASAFLEAFLKSGIDPVPAARNAIAMAKQELTSLDTPKITPEEIPQPQPAPRVKPKVAPVKSVPAKPAPAKAPVKAAPRGEKYPTPTPAAIEYLKKNPGLAKDFDQKYGPGAAKKALGK